MDRREDWIEIDLSSESYETRSVTSTFSRKDVHTDRGTRMLERMQRPLPAREREHALQRSKTFADLPTP